MKYGLILKNISIVVGLSGTVYGMTLVSPTLKQQTARVLSLSEHTEIPTTNDVQKEVSKGVTHEVDKVKAAVMNIKVADVIEYAGKTQKVIDDTEAIRTYVSKEIVKNNTPAESPTDTLGDSCRVSENGN